MEEYVVCPVNGIIISLEQVPDEMFAKKMLGDGVAIEPKSMEWYAPIDGKITVIYDTKHAIGITSDQGTEVLLHIGLDTYDLKGAPFEMKVKLYDQVNAGDPLVNVNLDMIKEKGYQAIAPIISTNKNIKRLKTEGEVKVGDALYMIEE